VLLFVFTTHLPFFAWRWRATGERRYAATTLTFALLVVTYGLAVFAPQLHVGRRRCSRSCAWSPGSAAGEHRPAGPHHAERVIADRVLCTSVRAWRAR
jgi:hypothetical protein